MTRQFCTGPILLLLRVNDGQVTNERAAGERASMLNLNGVTTDRAEQGLELSPDQAAGQNHSSPEFSGSKDREMEDLFLSVAGISLDSFMLASCRALIYRSALTG